jgi:hypothetical protein
MLSRKGGVGKTTLALHLAVLAQEAGRRTLLVDLDPQRSLPSGGAPGRQKPRNWRKRIRCCSAICCRQPATRGWISR